MLYEGGVPVLALSPMPAPSAGCTVSGARAWSRSDTLRCKAKRSAEIQLYCASTRQLAQKGFASSFDQVMEPLNRRNTILYLTSPLKLCPNSA